MRYKQRELLVADLRHMADWIEKHGIELPELRFQASSMIYPMGSREKSIPQQFVRSVLALENPSSNLGGEYPDVTMTIGKVSIRVWCERKELSK